jgi:hypothetical protein
MKWFSLLLVGSVMLAVLAPAASASFIQIQLGGVDLQYDGTDIRNAGSPNPDPLTNATFLVDSVAIGADTTNVTLDLYIPGVSALPVGGGQVSSLSGGSLDLELGGGQYLELSLASAIVAYIPATSLIQFVFLGSVASIDGQDLPFDVVLAEPVSISFSTQLKAPITQSGGLVTSFQTAGTGEIQGVPEPATLSLLVIGSLAMMWRRRK